MKGVAVFLLSQLFVAVSSNTLGSSCETNANCKSKNCAPVCNSENKVCIEGTWFFARNGLEVPKCVDGGFDNRKLPSSRGRFLGETCVNHNNCITKHCVKECGNTNSFKCIEPISFYRRYNIDLPKCADIDKIKNLSHLKVSQAQNSLGDSCMNHMDCVSGNCMNVCEDGSQKRCIEPRWSFVMYKIAVPKCIEENASIELASLLKNKADLNNNGIRKSQSDTVNQVLKKNAKANERNDRVEIAAPKGNDMETTLMRKKQQTNKRAASRERKGENKVDLVSAEPNKRNANRDRKGENKVDIIVQEEENSHVQAVDQHQVNNKGNKKILQNNNNLHDSGNSASQIIQMNHVNEENHFSKEDLSATPEHKAVDINSMEIQEDIDAKRLEDEALEKLRAIDMKVLKIQADLMKKKEEEAAAARVQGLKGFVSSVTGMLRTFCNLFVNLF